MTLQTETILVNSVTFPDKLVTWTEPVVQATIYSVYVQPVQPEQLWLMWHKSDFQLAATVYVLRLNSQTV